MLEELTPRANKIINILAQEEAKRLSHEQLTPEHILLGLIRDGEGIAVKALVNLGIDLSQLRSELEMVVKHGGGTLLLGEVPASPRFDKVMKYAAREAEELGHTYIGTEHLLLGVLREGNGTAALILDHLDVDADKVRVEILRLLGHTGLQKPYDERKSQKTPTLDEFGRDLTALAQKDLVDPLIGRSQEIERVVQILGRRRKNNPVLVGEPGVGKTAIVEGLAQRIVQGDVPERLLKRRILVLDLASLVAGTKYRGEFEERLRAIMKEIRKAQNITLFIDELHTIIGAGGAEGAIDAASMLKPALARGEVQCIGATTISEYRRYIEKDAALERRFRIVRVEEPSQDDCIKILQGLKKGYEDHHRVRYTDEALTQAVKLSIRYISDRFLPDKAIDLIDEAGAQIQLTRSTRPPHLVKIEKEILKCIQQKEFYVNQQDYEKAAEMRDQVTKYHEQVGKLTEEWHTSLKNDRTIVDVDDMTQIVSKTTRVPIDRLTSKEKSRLLQMEETLKAHVIGQDPAIAAISQAVRRSQAGLKSPDRPSGVFLFIGPTGVGKTELAKRLAEFLFGKTQSLLRVDMSEFMERFSVARLLGAPPGYVGYEEGGELTEKVRQKPYQVILLDEIEKAHPDVSNILLQIMEEGELSDNLGHTVNFRNTILIMTSNLGAKTMIENGNMGFSSDEEGEGTTNEHKAIRELKKKFSPEFVNRLDDIILFRPLTKKHILMVLDILVRDIQKRTEERKIIFSLTEDAKHWFVSKGYDRRYGARALRRFLQKKLENLLSNMILDGSVQDNSTLLMDVKDDDISITTVSLQKDPAPPQPQFVARAGLPHTQENNRPS